MTDVRWKCTKPNNCKDNCELSSIVEPTGCVYEDEIDIPKDANIWMMLDSNGNRSIFDDVDE